MKLKRIIAGLAVASLLSLSSMAGNLTVSASPTFARELVSTSGTTDFTFTPVFSYTMGVGVSAGTEYLVQFELPAGYTFRTAFADGDLTLSNAVADAAASITIRSGGGVGDDFVEYRIILGNGAGEQLAAGDSLDLDMSAGFVIRCSGTSCGFEMTATVEDDFGVFDESGDHTATFGDCDYALDADINSVGARTIDVADDRLTFLGGGTTDSSSSVDIDLDTTLVDLGGNVISDLGQLGELDIVVSGDETGIAGVTFPNLNGGTTALTDNNDDTFTTTFTDGGTDVAGGAVTFTVDGVTALDARTFSLDILFVADVAGNNRTLVGTEETLTNWTLNGSILVTSFYRVVTEPGAGQVGTFSSIIMLSNNGAASGAVNFKLYSLTSSGTGEFEQNQGGSLPVDGNGLVCEGSLPFILQGNSTQRIGIGTLSDACGIDLKADVNVDKAAFYAVFTIEATNVTGLNLFSTENVWTGVPLQSAGGLGPL